MRELIQVGKIAKAHGVRGELSVDYNADSVKLIQKSVFLQKRTSLITEQEPVEFRVKAIRAHHGRILLTLENIEDRNAAELLQNAFVYVPATRFPKLKPGEVYLKDLPGFSVYQEAAPGTSASTSSAEPGNLEYIGKIASVEDAAGQEIWSIRTDQGAEILFPAVKEFIQNMDVEQKTVVICPPPGLLEIYLEP